MNFFWDAQENIPEYLTHTGTCICKEKPQYNIINEGFNCYVNKAQKVNSEENGRLHQCLQGVFFALYNWNAVPLDGTYRY